MKWLGYLTAQTWFDALGTARTCFGSNIKLKHQRVLILKPAEFAILAAQNHRADLLAKKPEDIYEKEQDIKTTKYFMETRDYISPVVVGMINDNLFVLDGAHRLAAAYLTNSFIVAFVFDIKPK